ncbi:MAG: BlaI/MecI/CopY family transcriptional regulator [Planctomycetaceae bacterium]|nr:BlaI/MecI/CopY family transcriptional regulator [Planctomycetaceae bacterium]
MAGKTHLAELQLAIMQVLWDREHATVSDVRETLAPHRPLAYTTVGTMLSKMEALGYVTHDSDGRVNVYRPLLHREDVSRSMVTDLVDRLFQGDVTEMMCQLLDGHDVTRDELAALKKLIRSKEKEMRDAE